jgi:F0F1-type ATP synthase assembly protein I
MNQNDSSNQKQVVNQMSLTLALVIGQAGCVTLVIVILAVLAGLWLDQALGTRPTFTLILILGSIPVSLFTLIKVLKTALPKMETLARETKQPPVATTTEDKDFGTGNSSSEEE